MTKKIYDLEERTFLFAKNVRITLSKFKYNVIQNEDIKQVTRSSGSIGANYIEANESLSKKDFIYRVKISRKEAKESIYWLRLLLSIKENEHMESLESLLLEAQELKKILSSILQKMETK